MKDSSWRLRLEIPRDLNEVGTARHVLHTFLAEHGVPAKDLREIGLAITEAANNAIENANPSTKGSIEVELRLSTASIWLGVRGPSEEEGATHLRSTLARAGKQAMEGERGRGLFLLKSMMDRVGVKSLAGGRTEFWMSKKR